MGAIVSKETWAQTSKNKEIENQLAVDQKSGRSVIKLLLLGPGESGKSTVLKQMRILHANGFSKDDYVAQRAVVHANTVQSMATIVKAMKKLNIKFDDLEREVDAMLVIDIVHGSLENQPLSAQLTSALKRLWADQGVHECFRRSNEYQLNDSAQYFLDALDRISLPDYVPNQDDLLRARVRTTGIVEFAFLMKGLHFRVFDVGGQRSERKKWIHCFDDANGIMFVIALSEYDQALFEDETTNRMQESLRLFSSICNSPWFMNTSIILFLNKKDLFEEKIKITPLTIAFPDYKGEMTVKATTQYIQDQFAAMNQMPKKAVMIELQ